MPFEWLSTKNCFGIFKKNRQLVLPRTEFVQDDKDIVRLIHKMIFDINFNSKPYINKQSNMALYSYIPIYTYILSIYKYGRKAYLG